MSEKNTSNSPERLKAAARAQEHQDAPAAAMRVPQSTISQIERRHQSLPHPARLESSQGLLPLESRGLLAGGGFLALVGLKNWRSFVGLGLAGVGAGLLYSGLKNNGVFEDDFKQRLLNTRLGEAQQRNASVVIDRPVDDVFEAWSECSNLALFMEHIDTVERINSTQWYFKTKIPRSNFSLEWKAEIVESVDNEAIVWRTMPGSDVNHEGIVEFHALPDGLSTEVHCKIVFLPPAGALGNKLSEATGKMGNRVLAEELERFKYFMEPHSASLLDKASAGRLMGELSTPSPDHTPRPN